MKRKVSRWSILLTVFAVALICFDIYFNRDSASMTASMANPTLPTVSFRLDSQSVNSLVGNVEELEFSAARNTVVPLDEEGKLCIQIQAYDNKISSLIYTAYSSDGTERLLEKTEKKPKKELTLSFGDLYADGQSGYLRVTLELEGDRCVFYDTRIARDSKAQIVSCVEYAKGLHEAMLKNTDTDEVERVLETRAQGSASSLQHVTIYSPLEHATWGDLKPEILGTVSCEIQEMKEAYTSLQLRYQVRCADESICEVQEFFKVRFADEKFYLLAYDRVLEEAFEGNNKALTSKGIRLGLASQDLQYKANEAGTVVAFVQAGELWSYNQKEQEFACVFSFADAEKTDARNVTPAHRIRILSMDKEGNLTFAVYGYMNRGDHEGESGVAVYYYDVSRNMIKETAFVPSKQAYAAIMKEYGELAYYNEETDVLYVMVEAALYRVDLQTGQQSLLLQATDKGGLVSAADGHLIAYQNPQKETEAIVLDFATGKERRVQVQDGESVRPLGFVMGDFVYGVARESDVGKTVTGEDVRGMYCVEIRDEGNQVVKTYRAEGVYVLAASFETNRIILQCAVKDDGLYRQTADDYIANNEEKKGSVSLQSYQSELKGTEYRLIFSDGFKKQKTRVLRPKQMLTERDTTLEFESKSAKLYYSAYGQGELLGVYEEAGEALKVAKKASGVVISPRQRYVWEEGNRVAWYRNFEVPVLVAGAGESTLAASLRIVAGYEDKQTDVSAELQTKTVLEILEAVSGGEAVRLRACSSADMRYLLDKGTPVIALTGSSEAVVLVGYDAKTVTYINPVNGGTRTVNFDAFDAMTEAGGHTFFGYMRNTQ